MSRIFLSHSSRDSFIAHQVKACLEQWGHRSVFLDFDPADGIPAGRDWEKDVYTKLRECRAVIILCSHASMVSHWCFAEIAFAKSLGKEVFPIRIDDSKVDPILTSKQTIDATAGWDEAYQRLEKGLLTAGLDPKGCFDWDGTRSPYPGLPAFQEEDAAIFFGREKEIRDGQALLNCLQQFGGPRLTLMLGASGSGKSSLMCAGLLPRLKRDQRWVVIDPFRPLKASFDELAMVLSQRFAQLPQGEKHARPDVASIKERIRWEEYDTKKSVDAFLKLLKELRESVGSRDATVLIMIDQCEELLILAANDDGYRFLAFLRELLDREDSRVMVLATLRSDFLGSFQDHPVMRGLRIEPFAVPQMQVDDFAVVIEGPAKIAGLELGPGLVQAMIGDTKTADALPLLAFTLRELYEGYGQDDKHLTLEEYRDKLGRLDGCIARAAEAVLKVKQLSEKETTDLQTALLLMVRMNDRDQYAKQPAQWNDLPASVHETLERFVAARLLISGGGEQGQMLEMAHEALFRVWPRLKEWIDYNRDDLRLINYEEGAARRWHETGCHIEELWRRQRAEVVKCVLNRLNRAPSNELGIMLAPQSMLIAKLDDPLLTHHDRLCIGQKLAEFGDIRPGVGLVDGMPDIVWMEISEGTIVLKEVDHVFKVKSFRIATYPVTNAQFDVFLNAQDGYQNAEWWRNIKQSREVAQPSWWEANTPRETVSWYEAVAYCRWLSAKTGTSIRLPAEWEWQLAVTDGDSLREYPWKGKWDGQRCNSWEAHLNRPTAVGMYHHGATEHSVLDMVGNVWEWCLNKSKRPEEPEAVHIDEENEARVIRGGSWFDASLNLRASFRDGNFADSRHNFLGFRLAQDIES